jgi:hypothetical protein
VHDGSRPLRTAERWARYESLNVAGGSRLQRSRCRRTRTSALPRPSRVGLLAVTDVRGHVAAPAGRLGDLRPTRVAKARGLVRRHPGRKDRGHCARRQTRSSVSVSDRIGHPLLPAKPRLDPKKLRRKGGRVGSRRLAASRVFFDSREHLGPLLLNSGQRSRVKTQQRQDRSPCHDALAARNGLAGPSARRVSRETSPSQRFSASARARIFVMGSSGVPRRAATSGLSATAVPFSRQTEYCSGLLREGWAGEVRLLGSKHSTDSTERARSDLTESLMA